MATITAATFSSDIVKFIRDDFQSNLTDPISGKRSGDDKFVMTSYPQRAVKYPVITVQTRGIADIKKGGMSTEDIIVRVPVEIRIWARNVKERNQLFDAVYNRLRTNQLPASTSTTSLGSNLFDFALTGTTYVDEPGEEGKHSAIMNIQFTYIASS